MEHRGAEVAGRPTGSRGRDLTTCPDCGSGLVFPEQWEELRTDAFVLWLRCPNCEWHTTDVFGADALAGFDAELDHGQAELVRAMRRLERSNMIDELSQLARALHVDAIQPMDF